MHNGWPNKNSLQDPKMLQAVSISIPGEINNLGRFGAREVTQVCTIPANAEYGMANEMSIRHAASFTLADSVFAGLQSLESQRPFQDRC